MAIREGGGVGVGHTRDGEETGGCLQAPLSSSTTLTELSVDSTSSGLDEAGGGIKNYRVKHSHISLGDDICILFSHMILFDEIQSILT